MQVSHWLSILEPTKLELLHMHEGVAMELAYAANTNVRWHVKAK